MLYCLKTKVINACASANAFVGKTLFQVDSEYSKKTASLKTSEPALHFQSGFWRVQRHIGLIDLKFGLSF